MKIILVDDERLARDRLQRLLQRLQPDAEILQAASGEAALQMVAKNAPDLMFLDIRMPGMDGIEVARHLDALPQPPAVVFCTAYDEYALDALNHHAVAYLLKPVREQKLQQALAAAGKINRMQLTSLQHLASQRSQVSSQTHRGLETMAIDQIACFLAEQKYVTAYAAKGSLLIPDTLKELEAELATSFVRVHRNALVSLAHIVRLIREEDGSWFAELAGVEQRPAVSRRHVADVKERLKQR
ncbi:MAG: two-component system response regulator AlgR [Halioglobus sp.]|jgi:two-component system response regulator AlgR